jgi:8-oxo-dGTP diphosphatase
MAAMNQRRAPTVTSLRDVDWQAWKAKDPATLVFVIQNGSILLIRKKRGLGAGKINGPGGRLEPGESPEEAAIREVQEELKITPLGLRYCGENLFQFTDGYSIHVHVFAAESYEGVPTETEEAIPIWAPINEIPYEEMWEDDRLWIPLVLQRKRFCGRYIFNGDSMLDYELDIKSPSLEN